MALIINIALLILLGALSFQDFRYRGISWMLLTVAFLLLAGKGLLVMKPVELLKILLINSLMLLVQFAVLMLYFRMKGFGFRDFWEKVMGIGDLLFLVAISIAFEPVNFIVFVLAGLLLSLLVYGSFSLLKPDRQRTVPLAGLLSVAMLVVTLFSSINSRFDCYDPHMILKFFAH